MHSDARQLDNDSLIQGDICIIGAGAAGISMAMDWINTPYKVILLEGGGFQYEDAMQELYAGKATGQRYFPLKVIRLHYFGGTTGHWAGFCSTFDEIDFVPRDWVPNSGWPIRRSDLDAYYEKAHDVLELGTFNYDHKYWQNQDPSLTGLPVDPSVVWNKIWHFSPPTRFGEKYKEPVIKARNIHLYTYANVVDIEANENVSAIRQVVVKNFAGKTHRVRAKHFVVACCSVQNARLLLASNRQARKGLGNDSDLVGRHFMEHLEMKSAELWLPKPDALKLYEIEFGKTKARAELAISAKKQEEFRILNGTCSLSPLDVGRAQPAFIDLWDEKGGHMEKLGKAAAEARKKPTANKDRAYQMFTRMEQSPNPESRVTLDTERDALGVPRARLNWQLTALEKRSLAKIAEIIGREVGRTAAGRVKLLDYLQNENDTTWPPFTGGGWHHMGTTRMSDDPKQGVTDRNCKVHGISNLYMAGASNFVTAAAPNPTLTLVALTLRLSHHLREKMAGKA